MEPKIAHRCLACGVTIRESALFCPQCGKAVNAKALGPALEQKAQGSAGTDASDKGAVRPWEDERLSDETLAQPPGPENVIQVKQRPGGAALRGAVDKVHRATVGARHIEEDVVQRVQKIRQFSSVVLDEAGYDPSLRFVLVAGALFVIFLILLILSEVVS